MRFHYCRHTATWSIQALAKLSSNVIEIASETKQQHFERITLSLRRPSAPNVLNSPSSRLRAIRWRRARSFVIEISSARSRNVAFGARLIKLARREQKKCGDVWVCGGKDGSVADCFGRAPTVRRWTTVFRWSAISESDTLRWMKARQRVRGESLR